MGILRAEIYGNANIGAFTISTDKYSLVPHDAPEKVIYALEDALKVKAIKCTVGGSVLLGVLVAGNSKGLLLPHYTSDEELELLRSALGDVEITLLPSKKTAIGNMVLVNDLSLIHI
mgnify:CR=1 FL=1